MPALRGIEPTSRPTTCRRTRASRSDVASMPVEQRVRAVVELHDDALERLHRRLDLEQPQHDRLVGAEQLAGRDAVHERVADLARRAGDGDVNG